MGELEEILAELRAEYNSHPGSPPQVEQPESKKDNTLSPYLQQLLAEVKSEFETQVSGEQLSSQEKRAVISSLEERQLLQELRTEFSAREQGKIQQLAREAQYWLDKLDPYTNEGLWFTEFAYHYDSPLEAAIDYLLALRASQA